MSDLANKIKEKTVKDKKIKKNAYAFEYAVSVGVANPVKARVSDILLPKSRSFTFAANILIITPCGHKQISYVFSAP